MFSPRLREASKALGSQPPSLYFSCYLQGTTETWYYYKLRTSSCRGLQEEQRNRSPSGRWPVCYAPLTRRAEAIGPPQRQRQAAGGRSDALARRGQSRLSQDREVPIASRAKATPSREHTDE